MLKTYSYHAREELVQPTYLYQVIYIQSHLS